MPSYPFVDKTYFVFYLANQLATASKSGDIRLLRSLLFPRFITKIELSFDRARIWYSFPLDALTPGGIRGAMATGSILITFIIHEKNAPTPEVRAEWGFGAEHADLRIG